MTYKKTLPLIIFFILFFLAIKFIFFLPSSKSFQDRNDFYIEKDSIDYSYITPNKKTLIAVLPHTINIYDIKSNKLLQKLGSHQDFIINAKLNSSANAVVSLSPKTIKIWDIKRNKLIKELLFDEAYLINDVLITADAKTLIYATAKGKIIIQDISSGIILHSFQHGDKGISSISLSKDEKVLLSGSWNASIKLWDLEKNILVKSIDTNGEDICDVKISDDKKTIVSSSYYSISTWNLDGEHLETVDSYKFKHTLVDISPNGKKIVSMGKSIKIWEKHKQKFVLIHQLKNLESNSKPIHISNDNNRVAIADKIIDLNTAKIVQTIGSYLEEIESLSIDEDDKTLIVNSKRSTSFWDLEKSTLLKTIKSTHNDEVKSNNGKIVLSYNSKLIKIKNLESSKIIRTIDYDKGDAYIVAKAVSNDGENVIFANYEGALLIWNNKKEKPYIINKAHNDYISSITFSDDGKYYITSSRDATIKIWDLKKNLLIRTLHQDESINCIALSHDGKYLVSGSGANYTNAVARQLVPSYVKLWEIETGILLKTFEGHKDSIRAVSISKNNQYIAASTWNNIINIWDMQNTFPLKEFIKDNKNNWISFDYKDKLYKREDDGTFLYNKELLYKNTNN